MAGATTAAQIDKMDDAMDQLHQQLFSVLMDKEWKHGVAAAVDVTLLGRFYERFADHAVEIWASRYLPGDRRNSRCVSSSVGLFRSHLRGPKELAAKDPDPRS